MNHSINNQPSIEEIVEIHAPGIDIDEIMATIRRNVQSRQEIDAAVQIPEFEDITLPEEPVEGEHDALLYFLLGEMNKSYIPQFRTTPEMTSSRLDKLPLLGPVWNLLRRHLHSLSIFYTNKMGRQIAEYNRYPVSVLNVMTRLNQQREAEVAELKQRVAELEAKLIDLEQKR